MTTTDTNDTDTSTNDTTLEPPVLAADIVLFALDNNGLLNVLLIERGTDPDDPNDPVAGHLALPGGCMEPGETFEETGRRELTEETGLTAPAGLLPVGVYDAPDRDPRGRVISVAYSGYLHRLTDPAAGSDARRAFWALVDELDMNALAFDHAAILRAALASYPNIPEES